MADTNTNVQIEILRETAHGQIGVNKKTGELAFQQQIVYSGVEKLYGNYGGLHSAIHTVRMLSRLRYFKENLMTVGGLGFAVIAVGPIIIAFLGSVLFNGVQVKAGLPGLNAVSKGGTPPALEDRRFPQGYHRIPWL